MKPITHAPQGYVCPICLGINGIESGSTLIRSTDKVYENEIVSVFINSFFMGKNAGHAIVVPNEHYENMYDIPSEVAREIFDIARQLALATRQEYNCDGITIRQNNEPAGDQHAFHFHLHVFPRYDNDEFNNIKPEDKRLAEQAERAEYASRLQKYFV